MPDFQQKTPKTRKIYIYTQSKETKQESKPDSDITEILDL